MPFLDWVNKKQAVQTSNNVPYHLLQHQKSYGDATVANDNLIIQGDNLQALKALLPFYTSKVKCIFIDPPYNTEKAFEHYDDKLEHSQWLSMMYPRLVMLRELLAEDGCICITLDDNEVHYFKVLMDEVFGRSNYINEVSLRMKQTAGASGGGEDKRLKKNIEYLLIYAKEKDAFGRFNDVYEEQDLFDLIDEMESEGKSWKYTRVLKDLGERKYLCTVKDGSGEPIKIYTHSGVVIEPLSKISKDEKTTIEQSYKKYFDKIFRDTNAQSSIRTRVMEATVDQGDFFSIEYVPRSGKSKGKPTTLYYKGNNCDLIAWLSDVAVKKGSRLVKLEKLGTYWTGFPLNNLTKEGNVQFPNGKKPEALIQRVLELCSVENDLILDSFLGSGTTAAVAHKMNRRYIGIEMGEHAQTHCIPRLNKVIEGEQGGISKTLNWQGGGGFSFYTLGAPVFDAEGHITTDVRFKDLAAYIWWLETKTATGFKIDSDQTPFIGEQEGVAYYLLYNGILGDRRPNGGNVLTSSVLAYLQEIHPHSGKKVIFGEANRLGAARLTAENIEFKQIPYELHDRV
ncbi:site-specific DNA-methyltransferase [Agitococcus lubricus]|uniref:site-specific DNA-methyltransferase (adenine-specific) n=1 Tax=Agitococcus lubricus TaxID=1077255 RepID=A0A2T5IRT3_9GAMM|nr:site-specific DNA-methyltransferase [Agitococcus lubricus]PTQ86529.1 adenine-specific DNA-methyltransferase [Agitococcus lubricus]